MLVKREKERNLDSNIPTQIEHNNIITVLKGKNVDRSCFSHVFEFIFRIYRLSEVFTFSATITHVCFCILYTVFRG